VYVNVPARRIVALDITAQRHNTVNIIFFIVASPSKTSVAGPPSLSKTHSGPLRSSVS
jgi:hypothetical protein